MSGSENFNDSLDLSPLFWQLDREIQQLGQMAKRSSMMEQLLRIANEIKRRQMEVLQLSGGIVERNVELLEKEAALTRPIDQKISFSDLDPSAPKDQKLVRHFKVEAAEHDPVGHRILVFLTHSTDVEGEDRLLGFWVDLFDFPLTNFTRISKSERFTVLLTRYSPPTAQLTLIYFPSSRSGVKDKPFIDEVISDLRRDLK